MREFLNIILAIIIFGVRILATLRFDLTVKTLINKAEDTQSVMEVIEKKRP
jgi:hypothetical protein